MLFEIRHMDADGVMEVEADTRSEAKYKNYLDWSDAFNTRDFKHYLAGLISCKKKKDGDGNG